MSLYELVLLAVGLSMDAFAVSVSNSLCYREMSGRQMVFNSASFGFFQGLMPIVGYFAGLLLGNFISSIDHWLALVLLGFIGGKMLVEGIRSLRRPEEETACPAYNLRTMLIQAVATSIDALAVGISLAALAVNIWSAAGLIAGLTFVLCLVGGYIGKKAGALVGDWAQLLGGVILVGIGVKIFVEHMFFS